MSSDPWPWSSEFANNSENTVGGWADFSSANFVTNFANFNDIKKDISDKDSVKSENTATVKLDDIKPMLEKTDEGFKESKEENVVKDDVKVDNVECQTDLAKTVSDKIAQTDGTQSHADENIKSAAGDQVVDSSTKESDNKSGAAELLAEPSK